MSVPATDIQLTHRITSRTVFVRYSTGLVVRSTPYSINYVSWHRTRERGTRFLCRHIAIWHSIRWPVLRGARVRRQTCPQRWADRCSLVIGTTVPPSRFSLATVPHISPPTYYITNCPSLPLCSSQLIFSDVLQLFPLRIHLETNGWRVIRWHEQRAISNWLCCWQHASRNSCRPPTGPLRFKASRGRNTDTKLRQQLWRMGYTIESLAGQREVPLGGYLNMGGG